MFQIVFPPIFPHLLMVSMVIPSGSLKTLLAVPAVVAPAPTAFLLYILAHIHSAITHPTTNTIGAIMP